MPFTQMSLEQFGRELAQALCEVVMIKENEKVGGRGGEVERGRVLTVR